MVGIGHNSEGRVRCIFRSHGDRGYTKLRNAFLQDRDISDETRGLIARLLSLPEDWEVTVQSIIASGKAGRDKVYRMLKEAEKFGYIKPERDRKEAGKFDRQLYLVSDDPQSLIERVAQEIHDLEHGGQPLPENPDVAETAENKPFPGKPEAVSDPRPDLPYLGNQDVGEAVEDQGLHPRPGKPDTAEPLPAKPLPENPEADKRNINNNNIPPIVPPADNSTPPAKPKRGRSNVPDQYPHDFEEFWKVYPRREGKADACRAWQRLTLQQKRKAYVALKSQLTVLKTRMSDPHGNFCPHPATWINDGRFDDDPPDTSTPPVTWHARRQREQDECDARYLDSIERPKVKPQPIEEDEVYG